jgi:hypothetical protein
MERDTYIMRTWIDAQRFAARLPDLVDQQLQSVSTNYVDVDPKLAKKRLAPDAYAKFVELSEDGKKKVSKSSLSKAYAESVKGEVTEAAGSNRWLSIREARALPVTAKKAYGAFRHSERYSKAYDLALEQPFPGGIVDHQLFFSRHLPMVRKRGMLALIEEGSILDRLAKVDAQLAKGPITLDGGVEISKKSSNGAESQIWIKTPDRTLVVEHSSRGFSLGAGYDKVTYESQSIFERLAATHKDLPEALKRELARDEPKRSESEKINDRFQRGEDIPGALLLATVLDKAAGDGTLSGKLESIAAEAMKKHDQVAGEYLVRMKTQAALSEIAAKIEKHGEQCIGDADLTIALSDKLTVTTYDDDDKEIQRVLVEGRGPLLTFENHASGASFAVELDPLKKGELMIHTFSDDDAPSGKVAIDASGKVSSMAEYRSLYGTSFDIQWAKETLAEELKG